jgi:hypothetical protein
VTRARILAALVRLAASWARTRDPATLAAIDRGLDDLNAQERTP